MISLWKNHHLWVSVATSEVVMKFTQHYDPRLKQKMTGVGSDLKLKLLQRWCRKVMPSLGVPKWILRKSQGEWSIHWSRGLNIDPYWPHVRPYQMSTLQDLTHLRMELFNEPKIQRMEQSETSLKNSSDLILQGSWFHHFCRSQVPKPLAVARKGRPRARGNHRKEKLVFMVVQQAKNWDLIFFHPNSIKPW